MDQGSIAYLRELADQIYNQALEYDLAGEDDLATASLEVAMQVQCAIAESGGKPIRESQSKQ